MEISGFLSIDKPKDYTSYQAVALVKKIIKCKKIGHDGTLDPFATGVLTLYLNHATKFINYINSDYKEYRTTLKFGEKTDTGDLTGKITGEKRFDHINFEDFERSLSRFTGEIKQIPPMYSAVKFKGKPLYKYARSGKIVERKERIAAVTCIEIVKFEPPFVELHIKCKSGVYIRTLCEDIAENLDTFSHLVELRRLANGNYSDKDSIPLETMKNLKSTLEIPIVTLHDFFSKFKKIELDEAALKSFINGDLNKIDSWVKSYFFEKKEDFTEGYFTFISKTGKLIGILNVEKDLKFSFKTFAGWV